MWYFRNKVPDSLVSIFSLFTVKQLVGHFSALNVRNVVLPFVLWTRRRIHL